MSASSLARGASSLLAQLTGAAKRELQPGYVCSVNRFFSTAGTEAAQDSEPAPGEIGEVSGIPMEHLHRKALVIAGGLIFGDLQCDRFTEKDQAYAQVMIYSPARTASQQGLSKVGRWKIGFDSTSKWENPLMGWTSTGDPYASVGDAGLSFESKDAAVAFAKKHGWEYTVKEPHRAIKKVKTYADNFKWKGPVPASESSS